MKSLNEREKNMKDVTFECATCLNAGTPICEKCRVIEKPSGRATRPTHYCGDSETAAHGLLPGDVGAILLVRLQCGNPLPLRLVMRYNEHLMREAQAERSCEAVGVSPCPTSEHADGECGSIPDCGGADLRGGD